MGSSSSTAAEDQPIPTQPSVDLLHIEIERSLGSNFAVTQLIRMVVEYVAPFTTTRTVYRIDADGLFDPREEILLSYAKNDSEYIVANWRDHCFYKLTRGTCPYRYERSCTAMAAWCGVPVVPRGAETDVLMLCCVLRCRIGTGKIEQPRYLRLIFAGPGPQSHPPR